MSDWPIKRMFYQPQIWILWNCGDMWRQSIGNIWWWGGFFMCYPNRSKPWDLTYWKILENGWVFHFCGGSTPLKNMKVIQDQDPGITWRNNASTRTAQVNISRVENPYLIPEVNKYCIWMTTVIHSSQEFRLSKKTLWKWPELGVNPTFSDWPK